MPRKPIADVVSRAVGHAPLRITAYDGSSAGPADASITIRLNSPAALTYLITAPSSLGLARAFVSGELEIHGDLYDALSILWSDRIGRVPWSERMHVVRNVDPKALRWIEPPAEEYGARRLRYGFRHSKARDAEAISHHYDVSNRFYEWVLGPSMTYTCACYPVSDASLETAQAHKYDLVARKLGLQPGMRLLDVGCGWGGMVQHAARHYGARAVGVTLTPQHTEWARRSFQAAGVSDLAEVRLSDYRDLTDGGFDAISSMGLTEHLGKAQLPAYFSFLF